MGIGLVRASQKAGSPTVGTLRRYHPSRSVCLVAGWPQHIGGAVAVGTLRRYQHVLHTGAGRYRSARFAIPCGGPGFGRVVKGWDVPNGSIVGLHHVWRSVACQTCRDLRRVVPSDRAAVLEAAVEFAASKVGQALGPRRLSTLAVEPVASLRRSGRRSPRLAQERTRHNHMHRGCNAFDVESRGPNSKLDSEARSA